MALADRVSNVPMRWRGSLHRHARRAASVPVQRLPQADLGQRGTIFASSKLPLRIWFKSDLPLTQSKKGISSIELGRRLGVTQTAAWMMKHKLAQVMLERNASKRLKGNVQMDDAYIGGARSGRRGRGARQDAVRRCGRDDRRRQAGSNHPAARQSVQQGSRSESSPALRSTAAPTSSPTVWRVSPPSPSRMPRTVDQDRQRRRSRQTPAFKWVNTALGNIKAALVGTYRAVREKHVPRYLAEFEYRFNRRYDLADHDPTPRLRRAAHRANALPPAKAG